MTDSARKLGAVYGVSIPVFAAFAVATVGGFGGVAAGNQGVSLSCVGASGGAAYGTDSGLTVYENDPDVRYGTFGAAGNAATFDGLALSAVGNAQVRLARGASVVAEAVDTGVTLDTATVGASGAVGFRMAASTHRIDVHTPTPTAGVTATEPPQRPGGTDTEPDASTDGTGGLPVPLALGGLLAPGALGALAPGVLRWRD